MRALFFLIVGLAGCGGSDPDETGETGDVEAELNGCLSTTAEDHTGEAEVHIAVTGGTAYTPPCIVVDAGTTVTFDTDFTIHPLRGGEVDADGVRQPDAASPITSTDTGTTASFTIPAGEHPFYCDVHFSMGMMGVVYAN